MPLPSSRDMRQSAALLADTSVRLADLQFPWSREHIRRTRLAYIHVDNLLHFAKIDRDGRIDGYIASWLPDELAVLFLKRGELISAAAFTEAGREVVPIAVALERMRKELERGELSYCEADMEQLGWMYESCAGTLRGYPVRHDDPGRLFTALQEERFDGVLELISDGRVSYFRFDEGQYRAGYFTGRDDGQPVPVFVEAQFRARADGTSPVLTARTFALRDGVPEQASPALIESYRDLFWRIAEAGERHAPDEAMRRAHKVRDTLQSTHPALDAIGIPRDRQARPLVATPEQLTLALCDWALELLQQLEVIVPGIAPDVLRDATREHRFVLQKAGFYKRLPWTVGW